MLAGVAPYSMRTVGVVPATIGYRVRLPPCTVNKCGESGWRNHDHSDLLGVILGMERKRWCGSRKACDWCQAFNEMHTYAAAFIKKIREGEQLVNLLVSHATGKPADSRECEALRRELLADSESASLMPAFVRTNRNLSSFWGLSR